MGSVVGPNGTPRWWWHASDHPTSAVLASVVGRRKDEGLLQLPTWLAPLGLTRFSPGQGGTDTRHREADVHRPGKRHPQRIERKPLP